MFILYIFAAVWHWGIWCTIYSELNASESGFLHNETSWIFIVFFLKKKGYFANKK